jgi:tRNA (guanine-N7-)-methyltransferase
MHEDERPAARTEPDPRRYIALAPKAPEGPIALDALWPAAGGDIEIEVGFGRGMFLLERAAAAPSARLLGIEIKRKWAYLVEQRVQKLGLAHVRVWGGDAREILPRLVPHGAVTRVFMHFPDPWWKKRHAKRQLRGPEMLDLFAQLLKPGGQLFVQTDVEERAAVFLEDLRAHGAWLVPADGYVTENPFGARSNREKRAIEDGLPVYRLLVQRR